MFTFANGDPFKDLQLEPLDAEETLPPPVLNSKGALTAKDFYAQQIEAVKEALKPYDAKIEGLLAEVKSLDVAGVTENEMGIKLGRQCKDLAGAIEKRRKDMVEEPNAYVKSINNLAAHYKGRLEEGERLAKDKIKGYAVKLQIAAQKAQEEERQARMLMQKKLDEEAAALTAQAKAKDVTAPTIVAPQLAASAPVEPAKTIRTAEGKATMVATWKYEITDRNQVPDEYLMVNDSAIKQAIKSGIKNIPGVRIYEDHTIRF